MDVVRSVCNKYLVCALYRLHYLSYTQPTSPLECPSLNFEKFPPIDFYDYVLFFFSVIFLDFLVNIFGFFNFEKFAPLDRFL